MEFLTLNACVPEQRELWIKALGKLPSNRRDVYFSPEYLLAYEIEGLGKATCVVALEGDAVWLHPFLKCEIPHTGVDEASETLFDIQSAYGYGGPIANEAGSDSSFLQKAWRAFDDWCKASGIIAEFIRFHPLLDNSRYAPTEMRVCDDRVTVPIALGEYEQSLWNSSYYRVQRQMLRKAERVGLAFEAVPILPELPWFIELYAETHSSSGWSGQTRFGAAYFSNLASGLGENAWLAVVKASGVASAAVLVIQGAFIAHAHLMGQKRTERAAGATNLLYHGTAMEAARRGMQTLHMGGGRTADAEDSLLKFKESLSPDRAVFKVGMRCHHEGHFERLISIWEKTHGPRPNNYFLCYRL